MVEDAEVVLEAVVRAGVVGLVVAEEGVEVEEAEVVEEDVAAGAAGADKVFVEDMAAEKERGDIDKEEGTGFVSAGAP